MTINRLINVKRCLLILVGICSIASSVSAATDTISGRVRAYATNRHSIYVGRSDHELHVNGDGHTDLDCWVYNARNVLVDSDTDATDYCILETPGIGMHTVVIRNLGRVYNDYTVWQE